MEHFAYFAWSVFFTAITVTSFLLYSLYIVFNIKKLHVVIMRPWFQCLTILGSVIWIISTQLIYSPNIYYDTGSCVFIDVWMQYLFGETLVVFSLVGKMLDYYYTFHQGKLVSYLGHARAFCIVSGPTILYCFTNTLFGGTVSQQDIQECRTGPVWKILMFTVVIYHIFILVICSYLLSSLREKLVKLTCLRSNSVAVLVVFAIQSSILLSNAIYSSIGQLISIILLCVLLSFVIFNSSINQWMKTDNSKKSYRQKFWESFLCPEDAENLKIRRGKIRVYERFGKIEEHMKDPYTRELFLCFMDNIFPHRVRFLRLCYIRKSALREQKKVMAIQLLDKYFKPRGPSLTQKIKLSMSKLPLINTCLKKHTLVFSGSLGTFKDNGKYPLLKNISGVDNLYKRIYGDKESSHSDSEKTEGEVFVIGSNVHAEESTVGLFSEREEKKPIVTEKHNTNISSSSSSSTPEVPDLYDMELFDTIEKEILEKWRQHHFSTYLHSQVPIVYKVSEFEKKRDPTEECIITLSESTSHSSTSEF